MHFNYYGFFLLLTLTLVYSKKSPFPPSSEQDCMDAGQDNRRNGFQRAAIKGQRWPNNIIPYTWDESIEPNDPDRKRLIIGAMEDIETVVPNCWKFVPRTDEDEWVMFQNLADACYSESVGDTHGAPQIINFGGSACDPGGMVHELFHTLGMSHEHSRQDRDYYVEVLWDNIPNDPDFCTDFLLDSDQDMVTETYGIPYNFLSIMHYSFFLDDAIHNDKPIFRNKKNKTAKNWDVDDSDVGQPFFLPREDIMLLAKRGKCSVPDIDRYNISNTRPTDTAVKRTKRRPAHHKKHGKGIELKFSMNMNK